VELGEGSASSPAIASYGEFPITIETPGSLGDFLGGTLRITASHHNPARRVIPVHLPYSLPHFVVSGRGHVHVFRMKKSGFSAVSANPLFARSDSKAEPSAWEARQPKFWMVKVRTVFSFIPLAALLRR